MCEFFRGRVIPADLEAKIIDAKQKVSVFTVFCFSFFVFGVFLPMSLSCLCVDTAGLCAIVCECHSWFDCIWSL